uniref:B2 protein n=1 Tax=Anthurium amnicola TaxID=1678845 RepID=A0A1D1XVI2_9ARAE
MGSDKSGTLLGDDSFLMGAIFMSNRSTKEECFRRKLFGSPASQEGFVKKIKAGMVLFLFEYEERKLYGVFEATSNGAMDIIPTAFISSGKLFSAQICFRRTWYCPPLTEAEFCDAIKENYYTHNKFHFHLSETQVYKLLDLFHSKKINNQRGNRGIKFISQSRHSRKNIVQKYQRSRKYELDTENETDLNAYSDLPGTNLDHSAYHKKSLWNADDAVVGPETAFYPTVSLVKQPELPDTVNSISQDAHAFRGNIPVSPRDNSFYQLVPGLPLGDTDDSSVNKLTYSSGPLDSHPFAGRQCYYSHPDQQTLFMSRVYKNEGVSSDSHDASYPSLASKDVRNRWNITDLQDSRTRDFLNRANIANPQNSTDPLSPGFYDLYPPEFSPLNQENYTNLHRDVTTSGHSPAGTQLFDYGHCASTSQSDDNSRGLRYFRLEPLEMTSLSEYEPSDLKIIESSFCGSPEKASSSMLYGIGPSEYQDEGSSSYCVIQGDEHYPVALSSKFHPDMQEKRTSVFSRLSGLQKASVEKIGSYKPDFDMSLDELIISLSTRKKYWIKMNQVSNFKKPTRVPAFKRMELTPPLKNVYEVPDQFVMFDDGKQLENDQLEPQATTCSCSEEKTEITSIFPFLNFKRRSEAQRIADETEKNNSVEPDESGVSLVKRKRRKLLRPSFGEEDMSSKDALVQNVIGAELFPIGNDGESKSVDSAVRIGNVRHSAAKSVGAAGGTSQNHPLDKVLSTAGEHPGNVKSSSQCYVKKLVELNSEGVSPVKGQNKSQDMKGSSNLHGGPVSDVNGNSVGVGGECDANGSEEVEMVILSLGSHIGNAKMDAADNPSGEQCLFRIGESNGGEEHGDASERSASGSERRHRAEYSGEFKICSCYLEALSRGHVCQTSARAAQDIKTGGLSPNQCIACDEATDNQGENIRAWVHLTEFNSKYTKDSHRNLVSTFNTPEDDISGKEHFTEFDRENLNDSQRNVVSTALGGQPSSSTCLHYSEKSSRDAEKENAAAERSPDLDGNYKKSSKGDLAKGAKGAGTGDFLSNSCIIDKDQSAEGTTVKFCGKRPLHAVAENEMKASYQHLVCAAVDMAMGASLSKPSTIQTGKNTEDNVNVPEFVRPGGRLSNPVIKISEEAGEIRGMKKG